MREVRREDANLNTLVDSVPESLAASMTEQCSAFYELIQGPVVVKVGGRLVVEQSRAYDAPIAGEEARVYDNKATGSAGAGGSWSCACGKCMWC